MTLSPDGEWVVYRVGAAAGNRDIYAARVDADTVVVPLATTEFGERAATLSPDGRWFAYVSDESGRDEVYVKPFPKANDGRWQVSTEGGQEPMWAHSGRELFYRNSDDEMVTVAVTTQSTFGVGRKEVLFSAAEYLGDFNHVLYDVAPDDQRFAMLREVRADDSELIWVENWFTELKALVGNE
jgi:eukaryotic-like serine/threonine-protein kinase